MENLIEDSINELTQKVNAEKVCLLEERLYCILGFKVEIEKEVLKAFPRIAKKYSQIDQSEAYFWNDGTNTGKLIITFYPLEPVYSRDFNKATVTAGFNYK